MQAKILDEYVNYMGIYMRLNNLDFINNIKRYSIFKHLQHLIEDRILFRYKIKLPPYHGYNPIHEQETNLIDDFFKDTKKYMEDKNIKNDMYDNLDKIQQEFINLVNNKKEIFSKLYLGDNKIIKNNKYVKYKNLKINLDNRLRFILNKIKRKKFLRLILRYLGYGITAQHCSIPFNTYKYMYDTFKIRGEGFSSPLNSKLLHLDNTVFCTLFRDTDKYIGSEGPFTAKNIIKNSDKNWTVNPPYMENLMEYASKQLIKAIEHIDREDFLAIWLMPKWKDSKTYQYLKTSKYLVKYIEPFEGKHYMNCNGKIVYMDKVVNCMFFLSKKYIITNDQINKLLYIWNIYEKDDDNQSNLIEPEII